MDAAKLKKFAQYARRNLIEQVSNKLDLVLSQESAERRKHPQAVKKLEEQIQAHGEEQVIEKVAYIWFNRFCALRFMDVNRYTRIGVVSPAEGQFQPEILAEAKMGHIDEGMVDELARQRIFALLDGKTPSQDPQAEAYRLLVVAICNYWHGSMPFMFERITDFTELLMPDDLLSGNCRVPGGFPSGCGAAYSAMIDRIRDRKPPLPNFGSCAVNPSKGSGSHMSFDWGIAAYIPLHRECVQWDWSGDSCIRYDTVPESYVRGRRCNINEDRSDPPYCTKTVRWSEVFIEDTLAGPTYYW